MTEGERQERQSGNVGNDRAGTTGATGTIVEWLDRGQLPAEAFTIATSPRHSHRQLTLSFPPVVSGNPGFYSLSLMSRTGVSIGFPIKNVGNDRGGTTGTTERERQE